MTMGALEQTMTLERRIRPVYGYYRQPNGDITASPMTSMEELKYRRDGWEPLPQYGRFDMVTGYAANHPLELLYIMGGARELTVDQIRKQGLHLSTERVPTCRQALTQFHKQHDPTCWIGAKPPVFPQLEGLEDLEPFHCKMGCDRDFPTEAARAQHTTVMHAPEKSDERTGESLAAALVKGLGGQNPAPTPALPAPEFGALLAHIEAMQAELAALKGANPASETHFTARCLDCGQEFRKTTSQAYVNAALGAHRRAKHKVAERIQELEAENAALDRELATATI